MRTYPWTAFRRSTGIRSCLAEKGNQDLYRGQGLRRIELRHLHPLCAASGFAL